MRIIILIIALLAMNSLFVSCGSAELDEEGWIEAGYIPPPDAPKPAEPEEATEAVAAVPKTVTPKASTSARKVSSEDKAKPFKPGLNIFNSNCKMKKDAADESKKVGFIKKGKKLWVDKHDANWGKVYRKSGVAFVSLSCFKQ